MCSVRKVECRSQGERIVDCDVADVAAGFAVEMSVLLQVRAITGRRAVQIDLSDKPAVGEGFEAVVDGG